MNKDYQKTHLYQVDKKISKVNKISNLMAKSSWIKSARLALGMSARQLGERLGLSAQAVIAMEKRELSGSINLKTLSEVARAMGLDLAYGFFSEDNSLEELVKAKAREKALEIVKRTNRDMFLEDQVLSKRDVKISLKRNTEALINGSRKVLWD
ncbi:helix-turn-helix domain-containing protein [Candidatus Falkowbacteria bacterium]|nr:helix-turn-helix domain-containing protein [Candidatus Falkowbacteria bacterium]